MANKLWLSVSFLALGAVGFLDALYLSVSHWRGLLPSCSFFSGCEIVAASKYAVMLGVPVAYLGVAYYGLIFILALVLIDTKREEILYFMAAATAVGLMVSLWFLYLQFFVIKALCIYCLVSAAVSIMLFILSAAAIYLIRRNSISAYTN